MAESEEYITAFLPIFQGRLKKLKASLKSELVKAKSERRKSVLQEQIKEAKRLQKAIKIASKDTAKCPHCGGII